MSELEVLKLKSVPIVASTYNGGETVFVTSTSKSPHYLVAVDEPEKLSYHMLTELVTGTKRDVVIAGKEFAIIVAWEHGWT